MSRQTPLSPSALAAPPPDRDWLIPSATMTALLGLAAVALMPFAGYDHAPDYFGRFLNWMVYALFGATVLLTVHVVRMHRAGIESPIAHLKSKLLARRAALFSAVAGMSLAGIDMLFFMWIKPEVTAVSPFSTDLLWADLDRMIFRVDPWRFFEGVDLTFHAWAYSFFWAVAIMMTAVWLFAQKASRARSALILNYFALWSIFGPVGQYFGSAAGPIFYRRIGLGDRFAELEINIPEVTQKVSGYLWNFHTTGELGVGAGISAMPSLHIATVVWIYLVFRALGARILAPLAAAFAIYIWALSVALGWHYAVDGLVGALGAFAFQWGSERYLDGRERSATLSVQPVAAS